MMGGGLASLLNNPAVETAYTKSGEEMIQRFRDDWDIERDKQFTAQYGQDLVRKKAELEKQWEDSIKVHTMPLTDEEVAQSNDPQAAPIVPRKAYRVIDSVTGEPAYIPLNDPEASTHFKRSTESYLSGLNTATMEYLDAASQFPNSQRISARAETMVKNMAGAINAMKVADDRARNESLTRAADTETAWRQQEVESRGIEAEAQTEVGRSLAEEGETLTPHEARVRGTAAPLLRQERIAQEEDEASAITREAQVARGAEIADEQGIDVASLSERDKRSLFVQEQFELDRLTKEANALRNVGKDEPLKYNIPLTSLKSTVMADPTGRTLNAINTAVAIKETEREKRVLQESHRLADRIGVPPQDRSDNTINVEWIQAKSMADASIPKVDTAAITNDTIKAVIYNLTTSSPTWQKEHVFGNGYSSVEQALGATYPEMFSEFVPKDVNKPVDAKNNMHSALTADPDDPYGPSVANQERRPLGSRKEEEPAPEPPIKPPTEKQIASAVAMAKRVALEPEYTKFAGMGGEFGGGISPVMPRGIHDISLGTLNRHIDVLERALEEKNTLIASLAKQQVLEPKPAGLYREELDRIEDVSDDIKKALGYLVNALPDKQREAKIQRGAKKDEYIQKGLLAAKKARIETRSRMGIDTPDDYELPEYYKKQATEILERRFEAGK
jgi:hypothetical protein